jgi:hypothetical protein
MKPARDEETLLLFAGGSISSPAKPKARFARALDAPFERGVQAALRLKTPTFETVSWTVLALLAKSLPK